jgi:hypothetical protein
MELEKAVCALTDPFCIEARGAQWSDQVGNTATITYQSRMVFSLIADGSGWVSLYFDPQYCVNTVTPGAIYRILSSAAGIANVGNPNTVDPILAALVSGSVTSGMRIVSAGARWWDIAAMTGVGGSVISSRWQTTRPTPTSPAERSHNR